MLCITSVYYIMKYIVAIQLAKVPSVTFLCLLSLSLLLFVLPFSSPPRSLLRDHYTVEVPLPRQSFQIIPPELREGKPLQVYPVLFNVGINEQQTIAERYASSH